MHVCSVTLLVPKGEGKEHKGDAPYKPFTFMVEGISKCFDVLGLRMSRFEIESRLRLNAEAHVDNCLKRFGRESILIRTW